MIGSYIHHICLVLAIVRQSRDIEENTVPKRNPN